MTEVKPVAWTQPSQLACIAEGIDHDCRIWAKRDMKEAREWWLLAGIEDGPDDVPLYAEPDFLAMKERAEKAESELERTKRNRDMYKGQCDRQEKELEKLRMELRSLEDDYDRMRGK